MGGVAVAALATGVPATTLLAAFDEAELSHIVTVPDSHQRTLFDALDTDPARPIIRAATEDDVVGICFGLWLCGHRPVAVIQQLGLFAAANALRWLTHDVRAPLPILAGLYGRDVEVSVAQDTASAVRLCTPLLDALEIPWRLIEHPSEAADIGAMFSAAFETQRSSAVLLGAPTV
jgi:sulfopyruvate decarboxylase TPP-binding subunit